VNVHNIHTLDCDVAPCPKTSHLCYPDPYIRPKAMPVRADVSNEQRQ